MASSSALPLLCLFLLLLLLLVSPPCRSQRQQVSAGAGVSGSPQSHLTDFYFRDGQVLRGEEARQARRLDQAQVLAFVRQQQGTYYISHTYM